MSQRPAVFFDRDGVVNVSPGAGYVLRWADFHFSPGIIEALQVCKQLGYATCLVTSQQGVGKGLMSQSELDHIHDEMQRVLATSGAAFDGIYACTCLAHEPDCTCRKPSPEMILRAAAEHALDLTSSLMVGDYDRDIQMAINAGVPTTVRILTDGHPATVPATHTLPGTERLAETLRQILTPPASSPS